MIYFDNSATTRTKPDCVVRAVALALAEGANPGRSGHSAALHALSVVESAREGVLQLVGADKAQCVFTAGCTAALNQAIFGSARRGHIIATVTEHNSVLRPLHRLREMGVALTLLTPDGDGRITGEAVLRAMRRDTYLVCINHASNVTGTVQELGEICSVCRPRGVWTLVDGAQSVGYVPIAFDELGLDLLAIAPHKALHAPMGVGALVVSDRVQLSPILLGGTGTDSLNLSPAVTLPEGLEAGTLPYPAIAGLDAAVRHAVPLVADRAAHNAALTARLIDALGAIDGVRVFSRPNPVGVVSFVSDRMAPARIADALNEREICVRAGHHCAPLMHDAIGTLASGTVRASLSCDSTDDEVDVFVNTLKDVLNGARST